jgi:arylsulfatase A-like enzyme
MSAWRRRSLAFGVVLAALVATGARRPAPPGQSRRPPNLILVSVDTLRADHLGSYGYARRTSPQIDAFRADAVLFKNAFAHASSTLPSHATMFTSLLPQQHGASNTLGHRLPEEALTLAEVLRDQGYRTAAVTDGAQMAASLGIAQGFGTYAEPAHDRLSLTVRDAVASLSGLKEPFFLFLHTYEVHHPYRPRPDAVRDLEQGCVSRLPADVEVKFLEGANNGRPVLSAADRQHIVNAYDGEIRSMDDGFGSLLAALRKRGLYDRSLVVLTSDHGEEFGEHGRMGWHGHTLYDELLRVPLMIKLPASRFAGRTVGADFGLVDMAPTLLGAMGVPSPPAFAGESWFPCLPDCRRGRDLVFWGEPIPAVRTALEGVRSGGWKLHGAQLFALGSDPAERVDVAVAHAETAQDLRKKSAAQVARRPRLAKAEAEIDPQTLEHLRSMGYVN